MWGKGGSVKLCPVSFGVAVGLTCALAVIIGALWVGIFGGLPMGVAGDIAAMSFMNGVVFFIVAFIKGFLFGFFVALFYDWIVCCCCKKAGCCCKKSECKSECKQEEK
jgi:hypothetical protein